MSDQNTILDALVYSSINNIISPTQFRNKNGDYWNKNEQASTTADQLDNKTPIDQAFSNYRTQIIGNESNVDVAFNNLLSNSTIKRACCLGYNPDQNDTDTYHIDVKIPYNANIAKQSGATSDIIALWQKLGYVNKTVIVPKSLCPTNYARPARSDKTTRVCDNFMRAYCENAKELYNLDILDISGTYNENEFMNTSPECGCYADRLKEFGGQSTPLCYAPRCNFSNTVYVDQNTRVQNGCPVNQCVSILNLATSASLGGAISVEPVTNQSCFSRETAQKYGLPLVDPPNGTPKPPAGTPPDGTPPDGTPPAGTPADGTPAAGTPATTIIPGISNAIFYGIIGGVGGLTIIIIVITVIVMIKRNNALKGKKFKLTKTKPKTNKNK